MKTIYKYPLDQLNYKQTIEIPAIKILSINIDIHDNPSLYALVDTKLEAEKYEIVIIPTGENIEKFFKIEIEEYEYLDLLNFEFTKKEKYNLIYNVFYKRV